MSTEPTLPNGPRDLPIYWMRGQRWQVICGDPDHWRVGIYSPGEMRREEVIELEQHDCPELFLLIEGRMTLVLDDGLTIREVPMESGVPIVVTVPHGAYCPDGPHTGVAFVVERPVLETRMTPTPDR